MWEHFQEDVKPHADIPAPSPAKDLNQKWFDPHWRAEYLDWYVAHSSLKADILPVANTQLGPGSLAAILGGVFEGGEDTIWIHPDPDFNDEIVFNPEHPNWILHKELLKACKAKANGHYYVGMPDLMEGLDVLAALKGTDKVLLDTVMQPEVLEQQMQQINDIYFKVFDELYDIIREGDEMAFCYFSSWAPGKMSKLQSDISTMISEDDYRRFVQPFIREQCQKIDYTLYHLDGVGAMHHLPALLEIEELGLGRFANDADLLAVRPDKAGNQHGDHRVTNVLAEQLLHLTRQLSRCLALCNDFFHQRRSHLAVWPHRHDHGQLGIAPDNDVQLIARANQVGVVVRGCHLGRRRRQGGRACAGAQKQGGSHSQATAKPLDSAEKWFDQGVLHQLQAHASPSGPARGRPFSQTG